jgi:transposase
MKTRRQYDDEFKKMAVELSVAKGSLKATAEELGITPQILTRWRSERVVAQGSPAVSRTQISQEQQEIVRLKKELKQAELERDILKSLYSVHAVEWPLQLTFSVQNPTFN